MAKQAHLQAILSAVDRTSPVLRGVTAQALRTKLGLGVLNTVNFGGVQRKLGVLQKTFRDVGSSSRNVLGGLGLPASVGLGALGFGFLAAGRGALEYAGNLQDATDNTGMAIAPFQELQLVFEAGGVSAEDFMGAVTKLNKGLGEAAVGKDKGLAALMTKLRIPLRDAKGAIRGVEEVLPELSDAFKKNENPAVRTRMAMELFGKSGAKLIAIMMQGGRSLAEARKEAQRLGAVLSDESTGRLDDLGDAFGVLNRQVKVQTAEAFGVAAPAILAATKSLQEWIAKNKGMLQQQVGGYIERVANAFKGWVESGGIERLATGIQNITEGFTSFVRSVGGFRNVLMGIGALILVGPAASLVSLAAALGRVALVLVPIAVQAFTFLLGPLAALWKVLAAGRLVLFGMSLTLGQVALAAAPFLLVIAAVAAAGYLIYRNWDVVGPFFEGVWERIKNAAVVGWNVIKFLFAWSPLGMVINNWAPISGFLSSVWDGIKNAATVGWNVIKFLFAWSPLGMLVNNWTPISEFVSSVWANVSQVFASGVALITGLLQSWSPLQFVRAAWDPVVTFLTRVWDRIGTIVGPILRGVSGAGNMVGSALNQQFGADNTRSEQYGPRINPANDTQAEQSGPRINNAPTPLVQAGALQAPAARVQGDMRVRFENAPAGMRVESGQTNVPGLGFNPDVGYRSMGAIG